MEILDVWKHLQPIFEGSTNEQTEIELANIELDDLVACVLYMMRQSRDCNSQFVISGTKTVIYLPSPMAVIHNLLDGKISASMWFDFPVLPPIGLYVDAADIVSLAYIRGMWNAMSLLALFDLLDRVQLIAPSVQIRLSPYTATQAEQNLFKEIWRDYENVSS
jgi:hypothetical protein